MERVSVLCLLLLLCSLSGAEHQDIEVAEQRGASPESANVGDHPQPCPPDVHAVLRDVSAKLAENRLMIQQLQTLNQEQGVKLKELEKQTSDVETLKQQQQEQAGRLKALQTSEVDPIKEQLRVGQVAFLASLLASESGTLGPFTTETNLVFKYVFSNIGNAYNPITGFFTASVRGAYHFEYYIGAGGGSRGSAVGLRKNGEHIVSAWEHQTNGQSKSANGVTLLLEPGDVVGLYLGSGLIIFDNHHHHSTFSGHMLFPM